MTNAPKDYDSASLLERSKATAWIRGGKFARVARKIAEEWKWPWFRLADKRIIKEVVESRKAKKQRIAARIYELKSSVSQLAFDTIELQEDPEAQERKILIEKYLWMMEFVSESDADLWEAKINLETFDINELEKHVKALEKIYTEQWWDLEELYSQIEEVDRFERNVDMYADTFGEALGLPQVQQMDDVIKRLGNIGPYTWWSFMWSALASHREEDSMKTILRRLWIDDPAQYKDREKDTPIEDEWIIL